MSKVSQAVEMLRVVEDTLKQLKEIRHPPEELPSDPIELMMKIRTENRLISNNGKAPNSISILQAGNGSCKSGPDSSMTVTISPPNELVSYPQSENSGEYDTVSEEQYPNEDALLAITEKLTQVTQLQDEVLSSLKHDVDALTIENHVLESRNNLLRQENSVLMDKLHALQSEGQKLQKETIEWYNNMQTQTSENSFANPSTAEVNCYQHNANNYGPNDPNNCLNNHGDDAETSTDPSTRSVRLQTNPIIGFNNQRLEQLNAQLFENSTVGQKSAEVNKKKKKRGWKKIWKILRVAKKGNYDLPRAAAIIK